MEIETPWGISHHYEQPNLSAEYGAELKL